jgi:hypothetical protein
VIDGFFAAAADDDFIHELANEVYSQAAWAVGVSSEELGRHGIFVEGVGRGWVVEVNVELLSLYAQFQAKFLRGVAVIAMDDGVRAEFFHGDGKLVAAYRVRHMGGEVLLDEVPDDREVVGRGREVQGVLSHWRQT